MILDRSGAVWSRPRTQAARTLVVTAAAAVATIVSDAALGATFDIDAEESGIRFKVGRNDYANPTRGQFTILGGWIEYDAADPAGLEVHVEIDPSSVYTRIRYRDIHLRKRFFETEKYPRVRFDSGRVRVEERIVEGRLTMKGVSRDVALRVSGARETTTADGTRAVRCRAFGRLNRRDFGVAERGQGAGLGRIFAAIQKRLDAFIENEVEVSAFVVAHERVPGVALGRSSNTSD